MRNELGEVMASVFTKGPLVMNNEEAKMLACRKALEFAVDSSFLELIIEGNNANVMTTFHNLGLIILTWDTFMRTSTILLQVFSLCQLAMLSVQLIV